MTISIIVALDKNQLIGSEGDIPWLGRVPEDLKRFKALTSGHSVIMGRKTYESLPEQYRPLPERNNIVLTSQTNYEAPGCIVVHDLQAALDAAESEEVFIIGGSQIYKQAMLLTDKIYLTLVEGEFSGDTYFPDVDWETWCVREWECVYADPPDYACQFQVFERQHGQPCPEIVPMGQVDPRYAKTPEYAADLDEILAQGVCPFCPDHFNWHKKPVLQRYGDWLITESMQPYENTKHHFLLKGNTHKVGVDELTESDWLSITFLVGWAMRKFGFEGGGLAVRFGPSNYTGATVRHLHLHLIVPELDPSTKEAIPVWFPFG